MANAGQKTCGYFCVNNELCRRTGVLVYPNDKMLNLKAPLNSLAIRKVQNMHQGEDGQNDQEENQQGNEEEFNQQQEQHQPHPMQG